MSTTLTTMHKTLTVRYFALLKECAGIDDEIVKTDAATLAELYNELKVRHNFNLPLSSIRVAVNDSFIDITTPVQTDSEVIFVPPVAGG